MSVEQLFFHPQAVVRCGWKSVLVRPRKLETKRQESPRGVGEPESEVADTHEAGGKYCEQKRRREPRPPGSFSARWFAVCGVSPRR